MWKVLTKCIDGQVQDLTLSDKTSTNSPDPTSLALLLFSIVQLRRKETGVKRYSLQKKGHVYQEVSEPQDDNYFCEWPRWATHREGIMRAWYNNLTSPIIPFLCDFRYRNEAKCCEYPRSFRRSLQPGTSQIYTGCEVIQSLWYHK